ncbi:hypothetical protein GYMLUDRAFT_55710 [Collybiopsis luxurians FD-317 M1]|nr:hypothetical protein GYMLUDRAFT_55710 [Collybiopsis luxurians FD-317 M1]
MPVQHLNYPALQPPTFTPSLHYQNVWLQHWGEELEYANDGQAILVHSALMKTGKIWILDDYHRITNKIEGPRHQDVEGYLLVGSPRIEKSTFLYYQLAQRLSMGWPTIIYNGLTIYFDVMGAYKMHFDDDADFEPFEGMDQTMCLIDSDHNPLPPRLWISKLLFPILVTSPKEDRYKNFKKQSELRRIIPKASSFKEALQVWNQASDSSKIELLKYVWDNYSPDFCLGKKVAYMGKQALVEHNALIDKELYPLGYTELLKVVRNPDSGASLSHKLVFSYSMNQEPTVLRHHLHSGMLMQLIMETTTARHLEDCQLLFDFFQHSPSMAPSLGHLFEIMSIQKLAGDFDSMLTSLEGLPN